MNPYRLVKKTVFLLIISISVFLIGNKNVSALSVSISDPGVVQQEWYLNMYRVTPQADGRFPGAVTTGLALRNGEFFRVPLSTNETTDFLAFRTLGAAQRATNVNFALPPWRLFPIDERIGQVCRINGADPTQKYEHPNGLPICQLTIDLRPVDDLFPDPAAPVNPPANPPANPPDPNAPPPPANPPVNPPDPNAPQPPANPPQDPNVPPAPVPVQPAIVELRIQENTNPASLVQNATIRIYDESTSALLGSFSTGNAGFITVALQPGQRFYFDAIKDGRVFGGRVWIDGRLRVYEVSADAASIRNVTTGASTRVLKLIAYPRQLLRNGVVRPIRILPRFQR